MIQTKMDTGLPKSMRVDWGDEGQSNILTGAEMQKLPINTKKAKSYRPTNCLDTKNDCWNTKSDCLDTKNDCWDTINDCQDTK